MATPAINPAPFADQAAAALPDSVEEAAEPVLVAVPVVEEDSDLDPLSTRAERIWREATARRLVFVVVFEADGIGVLDLEVSEGKTAEDCCGEEERGAHCGRFVWVYGEGACVGGIIAAADTGKGRRERLN
ncbi:hypothetical protein HG530_003768 [Fusarium avenaceum]|nr:hypothetical protein HG530_003768 [Fusarium avenaceum]